MGSRLPTDAQRVQVGCPLHAWWCYKDRTEALTLHSEGREIGGPQLAPVHRTTEIPEDVPSWPRAPLGHGLWPALQGHVSGGRPLATLEVGFGKLPV